MAIIQRTRVIWEGFPGAPGYTNLFSEVNSVEDHDPSVHAEEVRDYFQAIGNLFPLAISMYVSAELPYIDDVTGEMVGLGLLDSDLEIPLPGVAGRQQQYSAPSGAVVHWNTAAVREGRRVRGSTFLVPLSQVAYQNDGTLTPSTLTTLRAASTFYVETTDSVPVVWSRPREAITSGPNQRPARDGAAYEITAAEVPDMSAVLRSRRD